MADRYWVGGTGNWNASNTNNWSDTSGGSSGVSVPTSSDNVFVDENSGFESGGTISLTGDYGEAQCKDFISISGHSYTILSVSNNMEIFGSIQLEEGVSTDGHLGMLFYSDGIETIDTKGVGIGWINFGGGALGTGEFTLLSDLNSIQENWIYILK